MNKGFVICEITEKEDIYYGDWDRGRPIEYFETKRESQKFVRDNTRQLQIDEEGLFIEGAKYSFTSLETGLEYAINEDNKWFKVKEKEEQLKEWEEKNKTK